MKMKKRILISLAAAVTALLAAGITIAFMFRQTEPIENKFTEAKVACSVAEVFDGENKTSIKVNNDGNVACFLRVRFVSYWVNSEKQVVGKASAMPAVSVDEETWLYDAENDTYYFKTAVEPNGYTSELLKAPVELSEGTFNGETVYQTVKLFAEAIQAQPAEAVKTAWPFFADTAAG